MGKILLLLFCGIGLCAVAQPSKRDSLETLLRKAGPDTNRVRLLNDAAAIYWSSDPERLKRYAEEAMKLSRQLDFNVGIGRSYVSLGIYHWTKGKYREAIESAKTGLPYLEKGKNNRAIAGTHHNIGMNYAALGDFPQAIDYYYKALKVYEKMGDGTQADLAGTYNAIGVIFEHQQKYDQALQHYWQSYRKNAGSDPRGQAGVLINIGTIYQLKGDLRKAVFYLNQSRSNFEKIKEPIGVAMSLNHLGAVYLKMKQPDRAETHYQQALKLAEQKNYPSSILTSLLGLGKVRSETGQAAQSLGYYEKARQLAEQLHQREDRLSAYKGLAAAYAATGNFPKAYGFQGKWVALNDSVFNEESAKKIARVQAEYQSEKKQAEIELLKKNQEVSVLWRNTVGAGLLLTLVVGALVVSRQRLKIQKNQALLAQSRVVSEKNEQLERQTRQLEGQAETLATQARQLQELDEVKSRFFANISHEFRTPLTLIIGPLAEKMRSLTDATDVDFRWNEVAVMHRNAQRLLQLINQLLDLSKIESGKMNLQLQPGAINDLLTVAAASFSSMAEQRSIQYTVQLPTERLLVRYHADQLEKVVTNLLSNAFKFTPNGGSVTLTAQRVEKQGKPLVQIWVDDTGMGIAPEQVERVFERFYQGTTSLVGDQPGTGIGLSLVKEVIQLHNGTIRVETKAEPGARFVVELPFEELAETVIEVSSPRSRSEGALFVGGKTVANEPESGTEGTEVRPTLLIVEDNDDLRMFIRNQLGRHYRVLERENGARGLEAALELSPDLIISDWMMPEMDGAELCRRIKTDERTSHIPMIMLTALATQDNKLTGLETGADDYLTKPFDSRELLVRVQNLIESRRKLRERFGRELRIGPTDIAVTSADEKFLMRVMKIVEDNLGNSQFSAEEFGREAGLSRMQLHRKLTALTGQSAGDFIRVMRLKRAAQLLEGQAATVSEIAYEVGFNSLSYFSKVFREQFGVLPTEYANRSNASV
ncbi:tetratricopeptide repeat protein [Larkinella insperata]|uniref:histidine kinase n=1 Tax=Larkinella insperata TaxID=332158 RepID=A0ABW3Q9P3_9BACT|nr:tetratricopeptide repeat protein [Larkinella insperata]